MNEIELLDILLVKGWGNANGKLSSPSSDWSEVEEDALLHLMTSYDYTYGGIK